MSRFPQLTVAFMSLDFRSTLRNNCCVASLTLSLLCFAPALRAQPSSIIGSSRDLMLATDPAAFVENRGQIFDQNYNKIPSVRYYFDGNGVRLYLAEHSFHFVFSRYDGNIAGPFQSTPLNDSSRKLTLYRTDLSFDGSSPHPLIEATDKRNSYDNFYLPTCPDGLTHVPEFGTIIYRNLYPRIDMELIAEGRIAKYEFIVHPGGDPERIRMSYDSREHVTLGDDGSLKISNPFGMIQEPKPISFQYGDSIKTSFRVEGNAVSFIIPEYDKTQDLVIDPPRIWGTYFGGYSGDEFYGVATDPNGNIYATGVTTSTGGISTTGAFQTSYSYSDDGMLVKFTSSGARSWGTYIGGMNDDDMRAVAVDHNGDLLVCGYSKSDGLGTAGAYQQHQGYPGYEDVLVMKFSNAGARTWGTYYGYAYARDLGFGVGTDASNNVYVGGTYDGYPNFGDAFVAKFNSSGSTLDWATTLASTGSGDVIYGLAVDDSGNCYGTGQTTSTTSFATAGAHQTTFGGGTIDAFLTKLNSSGSVQWCTYYGGSDFDEAYSVAIDSSRSNIYVSGMTQSTSNIATAGAEQTSRGSGPNAFLSKWTSAGALSWGTYYGASGTDLGWSVRVDRNQNPIMGGATFSSTNIATTGEYQTTLQGTNYNCFVAKFEPNGSRDWGTYYGPGDGEEGYSLAIDSSNYVILAGVTYDVSGTTFGSTGAYQTANAGGSDAFLAKFCGLITPTIANSGRDSICQGSTVTLSVPSGYASYQWKVGGTDINGATTDTFAVPATLTPGTYNYSIGVTSSASCSVTSLTRQLTVNSLPTATAGANRTICAGDATLLGGVATGGRSPYRYSWTPTSGLDHPDSASPHASPTSTTTYTVIVTDTNGCQDTKNVTVTVNPVPVLSYPQQLETCSNAPIAIGGIATSAHAPYTYSWYPATGLSAVNNAQPTANPSTSTKYFDTVIDADGCRSLDSVLVTVDPAPILSLVPAVDICAGSSITLSASTTSGTGAMSYSWSPAAGLSSTTIPNPVASPATTTTYFATVTDSKGCSVSKQVIVTVHPLPVPVIAGSGPLTLCEGDSVTLRTTIPYSNYAWSDGETSSAIIVRAGGTYSVSVVDPYGCQGSSNPVSVQVNSLPEAGASGPTSVCPGEAANYSANVPSGYTYAWSVTGGTIASGGTTSTCSINWQSTGTGTVTLTVTDPSTGCSNDTTIDVTVSSQLTPKISFSGPTTLCTGDSLILTAPSGYSSYQWSDGETSQRIVVSKSGNYSVLVTSAGGCSGRSAPVGVTAVNAAPPAPKIIASARTICAGDTAVLAANTGFANYLWSDGSSKDTLFATKAGTYSVTVTNASGCEATSTPVAINILPSPTATITASGPTTFCEGGSVTLSAPSGFASYTWSNGTQSQSQVVSTSGIYSVTVQNANGCTRTSTPDTVTVNPLPRPIISGPVTVCPASNSTYSITGIAGSTATWSVTGGTIQSGQGTSSIVVLWGGIGTGSVNVDQTVTASECSGSAPALVVTIGSSLKPVISTGGRTVLCGNSDSIVLDAGAGYGNYVWTTGATSQTIIATAAGKYAVTVGDASGCSGTSDTVTITSSQPPVANVTPSGPLTLCPGDLDTLHAGMGFSTYAWSKSGNILSGQTGESLVISSGGSYAATVTNAAGCDATSPNVTVTLNPAPSRPNISQSNDTLFSTPAVSYRWLLNGEAISGATSQTLAPDSAGNYTVSVTDSNGCTATSLPITVNAGGSTAIGIPALIVAQATVHVVIPVNVLSSQNLAQGVNRQYTLVLRFNKTLLVPDAPTVSEVEQGNDLVVTYTGTSSTTQGVLTNLGFTATLGNDSCTTVSIDSFAWGTPNIQVTKTSGTFCLTGLCEQGGTRLIIPDGQLSLSDPVPNPTPDEVRIDYQVIEHGPTVLAVYDLLGHEVVRLVDGDLTPGSYSVFANVRMLQPGSYYYSLRTPSQVITKRLDVIR